MAVDIHTRGRSENAFNEVTPFASSSGPLRQPPFDVFINHRGPDTKSTLASAIYYALEGRRVEAFLDQKEVQSGELIPQAIEAAMRSAQVHIAIFSKDYAASPWCLAELRFMHEKTRSPIIPVFYYVHPNHLKRVTEGPYAEAFSKHERSGRYSAETIEKWKNAVERVASNSGVIFKTNEDSERGLLLKEIVDRVMRLITEMNVPFEEVKHPVGLDKAVEQFEAFLEAQVHQGVQIVGIAGVGGCGKTTIARKYCSLRYTKFDSYSFLSNVRKADLRILQEKLLVDLFHCRRILPFRDATELRGTLVGSFKIPSRRLLIVLDDVDDLDQLEALLPEKGKSPGWNSLVIVTTRVPGVLKPWDIPIHRVKTLDPCHAKELFSWHAFAQPSPQAGFEDLVQYFADACNGLPLFIKVIAGMLYGKPEGEWRSKLKKMSRFSGQELQKLKTIVYETLDKDEQYIYLDISCFFVGEKINLANAVWEGDGRDGLETLENLVKKGFVEVDKQNRIGMSDILRDLGRQIAIESRPARLWYPEQITRVIECTEQRLFIRGIIAATTQFNARSGRYEFPECCESYRPPFQECMNLGSWIGLKLLLVDRDFFKSDFARLSEDLLWLRWFNFQHTNVPSWLSMRKLRVLELYGASSLQDLWENGAHTPEQLREMIVTASEGNVFHRFPTISSGLNNLTKIALIAYHGEGFRFRKLPDDLCNLKSLEHLELRHCRFLSTLPDGFGKLVNLRHLDLFSCQRLWKLPDSFKELVNLEYLNLSDCVELAPMHTIIVTRKLKNLNLSGCRKLQLLPVEFAEWNSLRELHLKNTIVTDVPHNIDQLSKLESLVIGTPSLTSFPPIGNLSSLTRLKFTGCTKLQTLPDSLDNLKLLEYLSIKSSNEMRYLPEGIQRLANLQYLKIIDCPIAELDFGSGSSSLGKLKVIRLQGTDVTRLAISQLCCPKLETLQLEQNYSLTEIDICSESVKLVKVYECTELLYVNGIQDRLNPINFEITGCPEFGPDTIISPAQFRVLTGETRLPFPKAVSKLVFPLLTVAGILIFSVRKSKNSRR